MAAERVVPNAFRARSPNGSATPTVGVGRDHPAKEGPVVRAVPVRVAPGMPGRVLEAPGTGAPGMPAVSRFAVRQAVPGMRFVQAVGVNVPTGIAPPAVLLPVIGPTEPAAAQIGPSSGIVPSSAIVPSSEIGPSSAIGPSSGIVPDLRVGLRMRAPRSAAPLIAVPLRGDPSIAVRAAVPLVVPQPVLQVALAPPVLGLAGRMGPGPTVAILWPPALTAAEIAQAPGP